MRIDVKFGVSYGSDPHRVRGRGHCRRRQRRAGAEGPRRRPATCSNFGDSSLDFTLRFWIRDPNDGLGTVRSAVMLAVWDAFKRDGIEFPFPQRDMNLREPVRVVVERGGDSPPAAA